MASEASTEFNLENRDHMRPIRPKVLKLTDVQMPINRNRKKNKFKVTTNHSNTLIQHIIHKRNTRTIARRTRQYFLEQLYYVCPSYIMYTKVDY